MAQRDEANSATAQVYTREPLGRKDAMKVAELMTTDVVTVGRNDELSVADDIMKMKRVRHLPVLEDGRLVGLLSQRDLFLAALSSAMGFGQKASREFLKSVPVKEVMTDELVTVEPSRAKR
jgi:CBS domain-containing protein